MLTDRLFSPRPSDAPLDSEFVLPRHSPSVSLPILLPIRRLSLILKTPLMVALGLRLSGASVPVPFVLAVMLSATLLWASLYVFNEATDLVLERGLTISRRAWACILILPVMLCVFAGCFSRPLMGLFLAMTCGQAVYCLPPFRIKRFGWPLFVLGGIINPLMRLACGAIWGVHFVDIVAGLWVVSLHLGAAFYSRALLRHRDRSRGYAAAPAGSETCARICLVFAMLGAVSLCASGAVPLAIWPLLGFGGAYGVYKSVWGKEWDASSGGDWPVFTLFALLAMLILLV